MTEPPSEASQPTATTEPRLEQGARRYHVESLARGLSVLTLFAVDNRWLTLSDISRATGLSVPTVLRLVRTLEQHGYLRQSPEGKQYGLSAYMTAPAPAAETGYPLSSLDVLESFTEEHADWGLAELAMHHACTQLQVQRLLDPLVEKQYVDIDAVTGRYRLGLRPLALSYAAQTHLPVRVHALPVLVDLLNETSLDATLALRLGDVAVYAARLNGPDVWVGHVSNGRTVPLHATAVGKLLLASTPTEEADALLARTGLARYSDTTLVDRAALDSELQHIRETGLALDRGEWFADRGCVAAPVRDATGQVIAAVGASGVLVRILADREKLNQQVVWAANRVSYALGYLRAYY